ncbi:MAG: Trk system potassium transporter TrkA [Eubacteriales bacterium]|nr:Trk system potassium transporter TrkA [Eubacteriales bacterium]
MRIVIIGDGKVGSTLSNQLQRHGHNVTVVDNNKNALKNLIDTQDVLCVEGNGATYEVQLEAGVNESDVTIACTSTDELNMIACMMAKKLGSKRTIARVRNPDYYKQIDFLKNEMGLNTIINPELAAANDISRMLLFPTATKVELFAKGRVELIEFYVNASSPLCNMKISDIYKNYNAKILVCAVQRGDDVHIPSGDFIINQGDKLNFTCSHIEAEKFLKAMGMDNNKVRSVILIGGGKIGYYLAELLNKLRIDVKIIEKDYNKCLELSELLPKATIIHGDGTDSALLKTEGIESTDAIVALTDYDEHNIIAVLYSSSKGVKKVIAKINSSSYTHMANSLGILSVVSPKYLAVEHIESYIRAMHNSENISEIETLYRLVDDKLEAIEFIVKKDAFFLNKPLKKLTIKKNYLLACIARERKIIIPNGETNIRLGDSVVLVTLSNDCNSLSDIFEE